MGVGKAALGVRSIRAIVLTDSTCSYDMEEAMKRILGVLILLAFFVNKPSVLALDGFGLGVILGEPTGVSVKKWVSDTRAIDGAAAWSLSDNESLQLHADYLIHLYDPENLLAIQDKVPLYYGAGVRVRLDAEDDDHGKDNDDDDGDTSVGVRIPVGMSYYFAKNSIDLFVEIVPILDVVPDTDFDVDAAIGARFYFK